MSQQEAQGGGDSPTLQAELQEATAAAPDDAAWPAIWRSRPIRHGQIITGLV